MGDLVIRLMAFGGYGFALIMLAGQAFQWNENRRSFYLGDRKVSLGSSIGTFGATWMSAASLLGYTALASQQGYTAFFTSVNGWMLGLPLLTLAVLRLRKSRSLSMPQWLAEKYGDHRLRTLTSLALLVVYVVYLVIQFRAFGSIVASMLDIGYFTASLMVYLFVLYTTFGGLPSVIRSDSLNLILIVTAVTIAAGTILKQTGSPAQIHMALSRLSPDMLNPWPKTSFLSSISMVLGWGLGVAANPQYAIRIVSCKDRNTAFATLGISALIIAWIYVCLTVMGLGSRVLQPFTSGPTQEILFANLMSTTLSPFPLALIMVGVVAAAVSTANSQLLLAACSFCYDLQGETRYPDRDPMREDDFLFRNRAAVAIIASTALFLSHLPLPGILSLGRYSWSMVALCFLLPVYFPPSEGRRGLFPAMMVAIILHNGLVSMFGMSPEEAMLPSLALEGLLWWLFGRKS